MFIRKKEKKKTSSSLQHQLALAGRHNPLWISQVARGLGAEVGFRAGEHFFEHVTPGIVALINEE